MKKAAPKSVKIPAKGPVKNKAVKTVARKPVPEKKKITEKPKKSPGKTPGRKPAAKKPGLIGRKTNLLKMGVGAFLYSLELMQRIEDLERNRRVSKGF